VTREEKGNASPIPKPIAGVNIRTLAIGPMEAFVLSRVDGRATQAEIALATGLSGTDVDAALARLATLGAVAFNDVQRDGAALRPAAAPVAPAADPVSGTRRVSSVPARPPPYDPAELEAPADLEPDRKRVILDTYYRLETLTHYQLLKVPTFAEKKDIKSAYYGVVSTFHPDKYFGKELGSFKPKLERIFARITEAHDTLTRAAKRSEYDRYLDNQRATRGLDDVDNDVEAIRREIERAAAARGSTIPPERASVPPERASAPPAERPSVPPRIAPLNPLPADLTQATAQETDIRNKAQVTAEDRRRALARKLTGSVPPPPNKPAASPAETQAAKDALKRRYEARLTQARDQRIKALLDTATQAEAQGNMVAAANALRIAVSLSPEDKALADHYERLETKVMAGLADRYLEQAQYDEG
jgi:curved DNA-binding protein CbpA